LAVDTDYGGLSELVSVPTDELTSLDPGLDWVWREDRIQDLLSTADANVLFLGGCAPNQGKFYPQFDHIILLTAPASLIVERLSTVAPLSAPESSRTACEPAYPEERTCIPPGLPLDAPCAITDERNFTVLPPDPRRLDADGDGVGCEPLSP
jgi:hypothetical protein